MKWIHGSSTSSYHHNNNEIVATYRRRITFVWVSFTSWYFVSVNWNTTKSFAFADDRERTRSHTHTQTSPDRQRFSPYFILFIHLVLLLSLSMFCLINYVFKRWNISDNIFITLISLVGGVVLRLRKKKRARCVSPRFIANTHNVRCKAISPLAASRDITHANWILSERQQKETS